MKRLAASKHFQKQLRKLSRQDQHKGASVLKFFLEFLEGAEMSAGLGFKKINGDKYEIRIDIRNRIVMKLEGDTFMCHLVGNHDAVKRYLKEYRSK